MGEHSSFFFFLLTARKKNPTHTNQERRARNASQVNSCSERGLLVQPLTGRLWCKENQPLWAQTIAHPGRTVRWHNTEAVCAILSHSAPCITQALFLYHCSSLPIPGCVSVGPEGLQCCSCPCWRSLGSWVAAQPLFAGLSRSFAEPQDGLWGLRAEIEMKAWRRSSSQCLVIVLKSRQLTIIIIVPQKQWELNWKALLFFRCLISTEAENELYFSGDLRMHPRSLQSQQAKFFHIQPSTLTGNAASSCLLFSSPISVGCECAHFSSHSIYS